MFRLLSSRGESRGMAAAWAREHHLEIIDARALRRVQVISDGFGAWWVFDMEDAGTRWRQRLWPMPLPRSAGPRPVTVLGPGDRWQ